MEDKRYSNIRVKYRVWVSDTDNTELIGDDEWQLLKYINEFGSLKAAANKMGFSYRKAWGDLRDAETKLDLVLIEKFRGGEQGGSTTLTKEGEHLIQAYDNLHSNFQDAVNQYIIDFKKTLKGKNQ